MIRIENIEIQDFRGIKKLQIDLKRKNFGVCGPNGTGKSGIVDAIEFGLTGDITRLSGSGSAELSVKAHAPHVDAQTNPEKSFVKITTYSPSLSKTITIKRSVKSAGTPIITPVDSEVSNVIAQLEAHPEFALSRREIVKYILTPAGQRSKDVQSLLQLDQVEKARQSFQKIANKTKKKLQQAVDDDERAQKDLVKHLGITTLSKTQVLAAINDRRSLLQLPKIETLTAETSLKAGVTTSNDKIATKQRIVRSVSLADIATFNESVASVENTTFGKACTEALGVLEDLQKNSETLRFFKRQVLTEQGLELLEEDACPLCDSAWDLAALKNHLQQKLAKATEASEKLNKLKLAIHPIVKNLKEVEISSGKIITMCGLAEPKLESAVLSAYSQSCKVSREIIEAVCTDPSLIGVATEKLKDKSWKVTDAVGNLIQKITKYVESLPEPTKENEARDFLSVAQEKYDRCRVTKQDRNAANTNCERATNVLDIYGQTSNSILEGIYDAVQKDFTEYYRLINHDDEGKFEGNLTPSFNKLAFDVDFYGRGKFPPGAYHSEGHQDGMGLCLYLALMKHTLGEEFTFAVLDDVLMSVDIGHRREVCTLLKTKFPKTQFILTTHDPVWLQFMKTENLIQSSLRFSGWNVDVGPLVWEDSDVWQEISGILEKGDVPKAASTLRHYLEYMATVLADKLRASVEYRGDGQYDLGDLLPPVLQKWKALIETAKKASKSWGHDTAQIEAFEATAKVNVAKSNAEQWMINKAVHYNAWANLQKSEFEHVVSAYRQLLDSMQCTRAECREFLYVSPRKGEKESLRCGCGALNFSLKSK